MSHTADGNGHLADSFTIPDGVPAGIKEVVFRGSGGSTAKGTYSAQGTLLTRVLQQTRITVTQRYDPLAQTFTLDEPRMIGGVDFKFCHVGDLDKFIFIQIRETDVGIPNQNILGEAIIDPANVIVNPITVNPPSIPTQWTQARFPVPIPLEANKEYAIVVMTDDANHAIAIAKLGQYVNAGNGKEGWVTKQPYTIGVLLSSSNASTWTPMQDADLAFRLLGCVFSPLTKTVSYGNVSGTGVTDLQVLANVLRPDATCDASFTVTEQTSALVHSGYEKQPLPLDSAVTDTFQLRAVLTGSRNMSPILFQNTQLVTGVMSTNGTYFSQAIKANIAFNAVVSFDVYKPGSATVTPYMQNQAVSGGDDVITGGVYQSTYDIMTLQSREAVGDGFYTETWILNNLRGWSVDRLTRVKLVLTGTPKSRPQVRGLRAFVKPTA